MHYGLWKKKKLKHISTYLFCTKYNEINIRHSNVQSIKKKKKKKKKKKNGTPPLISSTNYRREMKPVPINMDYCLLQFRALKFYFGVRLQGGGGVSTKL